MNLILLRVEKGRERRSSLYEFALQGAQEWFHPVIASVQL